MIPCIFAYAKGAETQSAEVELADPVAALFLVRNDDRARAALHAWLGTEPLNWNQGHANPVQPVQLSIVAGNRAA
jgi:hypothetical protein